MPIAPLPKASVLSISSGAVLSDPVSVVKELLDNALDAGASSVRIELATNIVDVISVRDNGFGIGPDDRALVGKRYCTSKIRSLEDLETIGGASLGFRGEALSSLVNMAGKVEVSTRVDGELVGVKMAVSSDGSTVDNSIAHTIGTTVRATNIFHDLPVRKRTAMKDAQKIRKTVHKLLIAYAFARPSTRLSLTIMDSKKTSKAMFTYSPATKVGGIEDAVRKLIGRDCASSCTYTVRTYEGFEFQAVHPTPGCDSQAVSGQAYYVSVDGRPVTSARGTIGQVTTIFRQTLQAHDDCFASIKGPFLALNIICPAGAYDPNIEPLKTEVLFTNAQQLVDAAAAFFEAIYPARVPIIHSNAGDLEIWEDEVMGQLSSQRMTESPYRQRPTLSSETSVPCIVSQFNPGQTSSGAVRAPLTDLDVDALNINADQRYQRGLLPYSGPPVSGQTMSGPRQSMYGYSQEDVGHMPFSEQYITQALRTTPDSEAPNPWTLAAVAASARTTTITSSQHPGVSAHAPLRSPLSSSQTQLRGTQPESSTVAYSSPLAHRVIAERSVPQRTAALGASQAIAKNAPYGRPHHVASKRIKPNKNMTPMEALDLHYTAPAEVHSEGSVISHARNRDIRSMFQSTGATYARPAASTFNIISGSSRPSNDVDGFLSSSAPSHDAEREDPRRKRSTSVPLDVMIRQIDHATKTIDSNPAPTTARSGVSTRQRLKSSTLPLNFIPFGCGTHQLCTSVTASIEQLSQHLADYSDPEQIEPDEPESLEERELLGVLDGLQGWQRSVASLVEGGCVFFSPGAFT